MERSGSSRSALHAGIGLCVGFSDPQNNDDGRFRMVCPARSAGTTEFVAVANSRLRCTDDLAVGLHGKPDRLARQ